MRFKKTFKKVSSMLLILVLVLSTFQFSVFAEDAASGDWKYYIDETLGGAVITAYSGNSESVTVPSQLGGEAVKALGNEVFKEKTNLKKVTIPSGVVKIGSYCFFKAEKLGSISLPSTITYIGAGAFDSCTSLTTASLGNGITAISPITFYKCKSLSSISGIDNVTEIGYAAFKNCTSISSFTIKSKVKTIEFEAFEGCTALKSITIPEGLAMVGENTFRGCSSLASVTINGVNHDFGKDAFINTPVYNNSSNWINGCFVLSGCLMKIDNQSVINIPEGVKIVPTSILAELNPTTINFSSTVSFIGESALRGFSSLEAINVSSGNSTFSSSSGVLIRKTDSTLIIYPAKKADESYTIPSNVKKIGAYAFEYNKALKNITFSTSLTDIGDGAFVGCSNISAVNFPTGLKTIGNNAFENCVSIKSAILPNTVTKVSSNAFSGCSAITEAKISSGMSDIPVSMFQNCKTLKKVTIGSSVSSVSPYAFSGCSALETIDIGTNIKNIGTSAFENCVLIKAIDTRASIADNAFAYCTGLTSFKMKSGTFLGSSAFIGCASLSTVELPTTLETIGTSCFRDCPNLKKISVPQNVTQIGSYALGYVYANGLYSIVGGFTIEGYMYSAAQSYASSNGISFKKLDIESPGSIRKDNINKIIYLGGFKVTPAHMRDYLKSVGACKTCTITKSNGSVIPSGSYVGTGCKITLDGKQFTIVINGETTGDGIVTSSDYLQIKKSFLKVYTFDDYSFIAADVNPNGRIDTTDYLRIKLHFLGQYNLLA